MNEPMAQGIGTVILPERTRDDSMDRDGQGYWLLALLTAASAVLMLYLLA